MVFGRKFTEIRHEFVIGTTDYANYTNFATCFIYLCLIYGNLCPDTPCLILNMVDTKSLKKYGETTPRKPLCERFNSH